MRKVGKNSVAFDNVFLWSYANSASIKEHNGPLGAYIDYCFPNLYCDGKTWEDAEMNLLRKAWEISLTKGNLKVDDIGIAIGGDLNNQIAVTSYLMQEYDVPFMGVYGACSTATLSLINGSMMVDGGYDGYVACLTSSHNSTSERQFRYPTEYGIKRTPSVTSTVTGAGVGILSNRQTKIKITKATLGKVINSTLKDASDMGRAMAPAAASTLKQHFDDFGIDENDYDLIVTGDLSNYGSKVFLDILKELSINLGNKYKDSGLMIYDIKKQDVVAGGSGCACISVVMYGYLSYLLKTKKLKKILVIATGALLNPVMTFQGKEIPGIAHAVALEVWDE